MIDEVNEIKRGLSRITGIELLGEGISLKMAKDPPPGTYIVKMGEKFFEVGINAESGCIDGIKPSEETEERKLPDPETPEERRARLKKLAIDFHAGHIFSDRHIANDDTEEYASNMRMVFMPLVFMDEEGRDQLAASDPGMFYEYLSEAGPRTCNGMPMFMSMKVLNMTDTKEMFEIVRKLKALEDAI